MFFLIRNFAIHIDMFVTGDIIIGIDGIIIPIFSPRTFCLVFTKGRKTNASSSLMTTEEGLLIIYCSFYALRDIDNVQGAERDGHNCRVKAQFPIYHELQRVYEVVLVLLVNYWLKKPNTVMNLFNRSLIYFYNKVDNHDTSKNHFDLINWVFQLTRIKVLVMKRKFSFFFLLIFY